MDALVMQDVLTTTEAGRLIGRSQDAVRSAIRTGALKATHEDGRWYIERDVLWAWHRRSPQYDRIGTRPWERAAELLSEYGSASPVELARLMGLCVGNARKHLAILAAEGRAERLLDGQWVLTTQQHQGAA